MTRTSAPIPDELRLRTPRLTLRPVVEADAGALWPTVSDPDFPRFMTWDAHRSIDETLGFIDAMRQGREQGTDLACVIEHEGAVAGMVGLHGITRTQQAWRVDRAELGYWVAPAFQNRGLVTEASRELMRWGFDEWDLHKITTGCISDNAASRHVIEKLGFRFTGEQRDHMFRFGRWWNHRSYELCVDERAGA